MTGKRLMHALLAVLAGWGAVCLSIIVGVRPSMLRLIAIFAITTPITFWQLRRDEWRRLRARRLSSRECLRCGYSLIGNTSGVCPECRTAVAGKVGA